MRCSRDVNGNQCFDSLFGLEQKSHAMYASRRCDFCSVVSIDESLILSIVDFEMEFLVFSIQGICGVTVPRETTMGTYQLAIGR